MSFLKKLFNKGKIKEEEILDEVFIKPKENFKYECFGCKEGIDIGLHKWTKQQGRYFHKICWKKALNIADQKGII